MVKNIIPNARKTEKGKAKGHPVPLRFARVDTKCPHCKKELVLLFSNKEVKAMRRQIQQTRRGSLPKETITVECT